MAYEIINKFIPQSKYGVKAPYAMTPQYVTIHNTANDASALNEISYMTSNNNQISYHVAIDDKHAVQAIPFSRNAWHAGDGQGNGNRKSIGIEICYSKSGGNRYYAAEENAVEYTAHVLKQYGWGTDRIKWHRDWSGKNCPHRMIAEGRLDSFKKRVQDKLNELNGKRERSNQDGSIGVATVKVAELSLRTGPGVNHKFIRTLKKGEGYIVWKEQDGWLNLGGDQWASWQNGVYMDWVR